MTVRHMRIACWIPKVPDTLKIYNTYCFCVAKMVKRRRLDVNVIRTWPVLGYVMLVTVRKVARRIDCDPDDQGIV